MEKWTVFSILKVTEEFFLKKGIESAKLDSEVLLADVLGVKRLDLYLNFDRPLSEEEIDAYREVVRRRGKREPIAYILGYKEFYGHQFKVTPDVLIPRPETETLVEVAKQEIEEFLKNRGENLHVLEIGTGSGCVVISLALEFPDVEFRATDISEKILEVARENAELLGARNVIFKESNLCGVCEKNFFDFIIFNPPYIAKSELPSLQPELRYEPEVALVAPEDGNYFYRRILEEGKNYLREGGKLLLEVGTRLQRLYIEKKAEEEGWRGVRFEKDLSGFPRVAVVEM